MPRFVSQNNLCPDGSLKNPDGWIASHPQDNLNLGPNNSRVAHQYAQDLANLKDIIYVEVGDEFGPPCESLPNTITPEGQGRRIESIT